MNGSLAGPAEATVVLIHSWPAPTVGALSGILRRLRDANVELVPLSAVVDRRWVSDPDVHSPRS